MAVKKVVRTEPAAKASSENIVSQAWQEAMAGVIGLVGVITEAVGSTAQSTSGAQGTSGGASVQAGQSSQSTQTSAAHKNDISAAEAIEAYVTSDVGDMQAMKKINVRTFDITSALVNSMLAGHINNMNQQSANVTTHADEEFSARKRATEISLVTVGDAVEEGADDTDNA